MAGRFHCKICYQSLADDGTLILCYSCKNDFHLNCIRIGIQKNRCPMCRGKFLRNQSTRPEEMKSRRGDRTSTSSHSNSPSISKKERLAKSRSTGVPTTNRISQRFSSQPIELNQDETDSIGSFLLLDRPNEVIVVVNIVGIIISMTVFGLFIFWVSISAGIMGLVVMIFAVTGIVKWIFDYNMDT